MKKLVLGLAAMVIGMSSLFAWTNTIQLGVTGSVPEFITTTGKDSKDYKFNSTGISFGYIGTFDSGLALKANSNFGIGSISSDFLDNMPDVEFGPYNFNFTEIIGVGYNFINTDELLLGLYGTIGNSYNCAVAAKEKDDMGYAGVILVNSFLIGGELTAVYTPTDIFSVYASLSASVGLGDLSTITASKKLTNATEEDKPTSDTTDYLIKPYLKVLPSIGIAWKF